MSASSNHTGDRCLFNCAVSAKAGPTPTTIGLECRTVNAVTAWSAIVYLGMTIIMLLRIFYEGCVYYVRQIQLFMAGNREHAVDLMRAAPYGRAQPPKHVIASNIRIPHFRTYAVSASWTHSDDDWPGVPRSQYCYGLERHSVLGNCSCYASSYILRGGCVLCTANTAVYGG